MLSGTTVSLLNVLLPIAGAFAWHLIVTRYPSIVNGPAPVVPTVPTPTVPAPVTPAQPDVLSLLLAEFRLLAAKFVASQAPTTPPTSSGVSPDGAHTVTTSIPVTLSTVATVAK
jgi:hypothetical protein